MTAADDSLTPRPEHRFTLRPLDGRQPRPRPVRRAHARSARPGRLGAQARRARRLGHLAPRRRPRPVRLQRRRARPDRRALQGRTGESGLGVGMATTNLFGHPAFKDGAFTVQRPRRSAAPRSARRCAPSTSAPSWAPRSTSSGAVARAPRPASARTRATRSSATARRSTCSRDYVVEQGYDLRFAMEPKPNEPRGDIFLPTVGHALHFITRSTAPRWSA